MVVDADATAQIDIIIKSELVQGDDIDSGNPNDHERIAWNVNRERD